MMVRQVTVLLVALLRGTKLRGTALRQAGLYGGVLWRTTLPEGLWSAVGRLVGMSGGGSPQRDYGGGSRSGTGCAPIPAVVLRPPGRSWITPASTRMAVSPPRTTWLPRARMTMTCATTAGGSSRPRQGM
ncbi:hypothetical protein Misp02_09180 [Microtetraspora sp. NBRC 16547]|nr:hypothetical protein Misp02_09180 [Microtetraspora sp. NBRC 16547]